jgi:hypothetical protein
MIAQGLGFSGSQVQISDTSAATLLRVLGTQANSPGPGTLWALGSGHGWALRP